MTERGTATTDGFKLDAICEVGASYYAELTYDWRIASPTVAALSQDGYEKRLIRCEGEVE